MTQKEKVKDLFGFLMDLLEEPDTKVDSTIKEKSDVVNKPTEPTKKLVNPFAPHHPMLNPYVENIQSKGSNVENMKQSFKHGLELMKKMDTIDKENAIETMKTRMVTRATRPLIKEIEDLKQKYHDDAVVAKEKEEVETIMTDVGNKMGVTLIDGKIKLVEVPNELRDNIPLDKGENETIIGHSITTEDSVEASTMIKEVKDLPKEVREKLENSKLPRPVIEAIIKSPIEQPLSKDNNTKED